MSKNKKIIFLLAVLFTILSVSFFAFRASTPKLVNDLEYTYTEEDKISVYDFMDQLRADGKINFTEKTYTGLGKFIVSINGIVANGEQNWIYYVNGKKAEIGVSNYKINPGDVVSWKYEKYY